MKIRSVGVVGAGTMGQGIVQTAASHGLDVVFKEIDQSRVEEAMESISSAFDREIDRWAITGSEKRACMSRIRGTDSFDDLLGSNILIEAIQDDFDLKSALFKEIGAIVPETMVLVTNTSALSVSELAQNVKRRRRVIGMHFLSPVPKRPLVEIVRGFHTSDETFEFARHFAEAMGKTAVEVFEFPGFITTRVILPLINEALHTLMEGVASADDIDKAMKLGFDFPVGPLEMADRMGLDEVMTWMEHLLHETGDPKYRPCPILRKFVRAARLGTKTGRGIFKYDKEGNRIQS